MGYALPIGEKMNIVIIKVIAWATCGLAALTFLWDAHETPQTKQPIVGQITTSLVSVAPSLPTTTTTVHKGCAEYVADAISAGWPAEQAPMLAKVMYRESRCNPLAYNSQDSNGGSRGLMQVNGTHKKWLMETGFINHLDDLFNPDINLRAALHLYRMVGNSWSPWASTSG